MPDPETTAATLKLLGGRVCLDFANTVDWHASDHPHEFLTGYADLVAWSEHAGALSAPQAQALLREAQRRPADAAATHRGALALREALYRLFSTLAQGRDAAEGDLAELHDALTRALPQLRLARLGGRLAWTWAENPRALDRMLWPIAWSAATLLTSDELDRVRQCAGEGCGWLFVDQSRNHSRRWCAMEDCGNRAKARRHYARRRRKT
jgi:predicted RNA-binding Zn ribbon-like protein